MPSQSTHTPTSCYTWAADILLSPHLKDKLRPPPVLSVPFSDFTPLSSVPVLPGRAPHMLFATDQKKQKFPKVDAFHTNDARCRALHFFANHELLALEMMSACYLSFPHEQRYQQLFKIKLLQTMKEEQKHLALYIQRLKDFGVNFGDMPMNGYFWNFMRELKSPEHYSAIMSLTFEGANLDFAHYYEKVFLHVEDLVSAQILAVVLADEIKHVKFGYQHLKTRCSSNNTIHPQKTLWEYYREHLPFPLTPKRALGINYQQSLRQRAGIDDNFLHELTHYEDDFPVTKRREIT